MNLINKDVIKTTLLLTVIAIIGVSILNYLEANSLIISNFRDFITLLSAIVAGPFGAFVVSFSANIHHPITQAIVYNIIVNCLLAVSFSILYKRLFEKLSVPDIYLALVLLILFYYFILNAAVISFTYFFFNDFYYVLIQRSGSLSSVIVSIWNETLFEKTIFGLASSLFLYIAPEKIKKPIWGKSKSATLKPFTPKSELILLPIFFGFAASLIVYFEIFVTIPGTNLITDLREIFVLIGAALTGPIGGAITGFLSSILEPQTEIRLYVVMQHVFCGSIVGYMYNKYVYNKISLTRFSVYWILLVISYYYVFYWPIYLIVYYLFPDFYKMFIANNNPNLLLDSWRFIKGWSVEVFFTSIVTALIWAALPPRYRKPLWPNLSQKNENNKGLYNSISNSSKKVKYTLALRLAVVFFVLALIPVLILGVFIKDDVSNTILKREGDLLQEISVELAKRNELTPRMYYNSLKETQISRTGDLFLVDEIGNYQIKPIRQKYGKNIKDDLPVSVAKKIITEKNGFAIDESNKVSYGFSHVKFGNHEFIIVTVSDKEETKAKIKELQYSILFKLGGGIFIISIGLVLILWLTVRKPLAKLINALDSVTKGDLSFRVEPEEMNDELNELADSFNKMTTKISETTKALQVEIKEHEETEAALKVSNEILSLFIKNSPIYTFIKEIRENESIVLQASDNFVEMIGIPAEKMIGRKMSELFPLEFAEKIISDDLQVVTAGEIYSAEERLNNKTYTTIKYPIKLGEKTLLAGYTIDITDRVKSEENLIEAKANLSAIIENTLDSIWAIDKEYNILYTNEVFANSFIASFGVKLEKGVNLLKALPDQIKPIWKEKYDRAFKGEQFEFEEEIHLPSTTIYVEVAVNPISVNGEVIGASLFGRNITERKNTQKALIENERLYRRSIEVLGAVPYKDDYASNAYTYMGEGIFNLTGYHANEITPEIYKSMVVNSIPRGELEGLDYESAYNKAQKGETAIWNVDTQIRNKNGELKWLNDSAVQLRNDEGKVVGSLGIVIDITDRMNATAALRESEERFQTFMNETPVYAYIKDKTLNHIYKNQRVKNLLDEKGFTGEESSAKNIMSKYSTELVEAADKKIIDGKESKIELEFPVTFHGKEMWLKDIKFPLNLPTGERVVAGISFDITERRKAEMQLIISEIKYRNLFENLTVGFVIYELIYDNSMEIADVRFAEVNLAYANIIGKPLSQILGKTGDELFGSKRNSQYLKQIEEVAKSKKQLSFDYFSVSTNKYLEVWFFSTDNDRVAAIITDKTEKKHLEQLMIQNEKMASVAGLAAGMAHEINNPLGTIVQGCQNIVRRTNKELSKNLAAANSAGFNIEQLEKYFKEREIDHIIESIRNAAGKASDIIKNMLQFSRKSESKKSYYELSKLIDETIELANNDYSLKKKYDFRSILIEKHYEPNIPLVWITKTEIQQVIFNLFQNSAQALKNYNMKKASLIRINLHQENQNVFIKIEDNGPGIDEKTQQRIFEPFFTTKEIGEGTGLGLSVSYMIIKNNHHGNIEVSSAVGKGTSFLITLPIEKVVTASK